MLNVNDDEWWNEINLYIQVDDVDASVVTGVVRGGNFRKSPATSAKLRRRVSFEPLALLLDAALEGELEVVQNTASAVSRRNNARLFTY